MLTQKNIEELTTQVVLKFVDEKCLLNVWIFFLPGTFGTDFRTKEKDPKNINPFYLELYFLRLHSISNVFIDSWIKK